MDSRFIGSRFNVNGFKVQRFKVWGFAFGFDPTRRGPFFALRTSGFRLRSSSYDMKSRRASRV